LSKLTKFITKPHIYLRDAVRNLVALRKTHALSPDQLTNGKPTAVLVGFSTWKTFMVNFLPEHNVIFLGHSPRVSRAQINSIRHYPRPEVFAWSYQFPDYLREFCRREGIQLTFVEDGFIRSIGLGANKSQPLSLVFDREAMHFDRNARSQLDELLETYDFDSDQSLMQQARDLRQEICTSGLSKYNFTSALQKPSDLFRDKNRRRVLVLGQVEDDLSIAYGSEVKLSGNDLVRIALFENEDAQILYRPHPESLAFAKPHYSTPDEVADFCHILGPEYSLKDCIEAADTIYTVTSLAGFEAALHGKKVVVFGAPFYAGRGFTEDRDSMIQIKRRLMPVQVLAAAYILYPRYFNPVTKAPAPWDEALYFLRKSRHAAIDIAEDRAWLALRRQQPHSTHDACQKST
jgi:capsular polysaccharide export protein